MFTVALWCLVAGMVLATGVSRHPAHASAGLTQAQASTVAIFDSREGIYGSGVIIAPQWVLTASHVVEATRVNGLDMILRALDDVTYEYEISDVSPHDDLALLRVEGLAGPVIPRRPSGILAAGEDVYALGYPLGLDKMSVTKGIVSAPLQEIEGFEFVQTDASINPGNSGGPLVDSAGQLVGLNVMKAASSDIDNMGFAVPLANIDRFLDGTPAGAASVPVAAGPAGGSGGGGQQTDGGGLLLILLVFVGLGVAGVVVYGSRSARAPSSAGEAAMNAPAAPPNVSKSIALVIESADGSVTSTETGLPAIAGRDVSADVRVEDASVSRQHARITRSSDGTILVRDLSSRNGIDFEGERRGSFSLSVGASFKIGGTTVRRTR